jgi:hypothetical protein
MTGPFFWRLSRYFNNVVDVLIGKADVSSIFPNLTDSTSRERIYAELLRQYLPISCAFSFGGFLFDMKGNESKRIDLVILNDISPKFNFHDPNGNDESFACIDGCVAVASITPILKSNQLIHALENMASLPDKVTFTEGGYNKSAKINNYEDWPYKVIYASDGIDLGNAINIVNNFYEKNNTVPYCKRPNIIHVCGKYCIVRAGKNATTRSGRKIQENSFWGNKDDSDAYALVTTILNIQMTLIASNKLYYNYSELANKLPV